MSTATARSVSARRVANALGMHAPTPEQTGVIEAPVEPALVVAGAGAGKTETMASRVVWLVASGVVAPERVLGLTFTRKAARALADRVRARLRRLAGSGLLDDLDPSGELRATVLTSEPTVLTYHAYAARLVAEHGLLLPVEPGARVLSETAAWQLAHRVVTRWDGDIDTDRTPATVAGYVRALAGELAEHLVDGDRLLAHARALSDVIENAPAGKRGSELPQQLRDVVAAQRLRASLLPLIERYSQAKRAVAAIDFGDQMALAARLAVDHNEVAENERARYHAVLLDEYQDTGHAQRVLLRALFGGEAGAALPVTAVGDPAQAIYGWRGASAANLDRFTTDFPIVRGGRLVPAERFPLLTSFRNPPQVLALANEVSRTLRAAGLPVDELRARDGARKADIACALLPDIDAEREWLADAVARRWRDHRDAHGAPPTAAVLVRRRADIAELAAALRGRGLPVEVVGLGGLLDEPEVRDVVCTLRVLVDPLAGTAAVRLLTGGRWRLGAADVAALWRRARELAADAAGGAASGEEMVAGVDVGAAVPGEAFEQAGLVDAVDDPGEPGRYSVEGYRRITRFAAELGWLRSRMSQSLGELVTDVRRTLHLDIEVLAAGGTLAQLDEFSSVVGQFVELNPAATLMELLDYLDTAQRAEDGLARGEVEVAAEKVQVLTMHSAKGLEWDVVALPHLVGGVFPGRKRASSWLRTVTQLPVDLRGDAADLPRLRIVSGQDRTEVRGAVEEHEQSFEDRRLTEERRLFYVALTRSAHSLLCSGHWWAHGTKRPRAASPFLTEVHGMLTGDPELGEIEHWADEPERDARNPLSELTRSTIWPCDPLAERRGDVRQAAELVLAELERGNPAGTSGCQDDGAARPAGAGGGEGDADGTEAVEAEWARDVDVLLAERAAAAAGRRQRVALPSHVSVSSLVDLAADPGELASRLRRPLPARPNLASRRGTAFHRWLQRRFESVALLDVDELPGAADEGAADDTDLDVLREMFLASEWADRSPHEVEVPFETTIEGSVVRGRMDAVFADPDGGWTIVDWKTGTVPDASRLPSAAVQLAVYRLAWAELAGCELAKVRAAFHYVRARRTVRPADLLDAQGLRALLRSVPYEQRDQA